MHLRPPVLTGLLIAALAAGLAGQAPTSRPSAPSGTPVPGVLSAPQPPQTPPPATAGTSIGTIRGRVVRADTGRPLPKARVSVRIQGARARGPGGQYPSATTDGEGRYELKGLPAGQYVVDASKGGYVDQQYGQRRPSDSTLPLQLAERQTLDRIDFVLSPGGVITGSVIDEAGEPLAGVIVQALTSRYVQGVRQLVTSSPSNNLDLTDDLGQFRLFGLAPGRWVLRATAPDGPPDLAGSLTPGKRTVIYYPSARAGAEAQAVHVAAGTELTGLTIAVRRERLATVDGSLRTADGGVPAGGIVMIVQPGERPTNSAAVLSDGSFSIPNVPPGRYIVAAVADIANIDNAVGATADIVLDGANVSVALTLQKASSARGKFTFDADARPASAGISAERTLNLVGGASRMWPVRDDWTFEVPELVGPHQFRVAARGGWAVESIRLDGKDITDQPLDFAGKDVDGIVVHLTQRVSAVRGQVSVQRGQKVTDATVVLFADDPGRWTPRTRFVRAVRPDQDGRFEARDLPASRYMAVALEYLEPGEETNPETLEQLQRVGTPFTLDTGGTAVVNLKISPTP